VVMGPHTFNFAQAADLPAWPPAPPCA
jgi:hypothetical protein